MNEERYISGRTISKQVNITTATLRRWADEGKVKVIRPNINSTKTQRLYNLRDIEYIFSSSASASQKVSICYARVSSNHQKEDLQRQIDVLKTKFPNYTIISDIGSGLNWKRTGFKSLLELIHQGNVHEIVVTYKDRICRFGFELFEWILQKHNVKFVVLNQSTDSKNPSIELSDDLLAITTVFVAKNNGLRSAKYRKDRNS